MIGRSAARQRRGMRAARTWLSRETAADHRTPPGPPRRRTRWMPATRGRGSGAGEEAVSAGMVDRRRPPTSGACYGARRGSALRRCALSTAAPPPDFRCKLRRKAELGAAARCALSTAAPTSDFRRKLRRKTELGAAALRAPDRGAAPRLPGASYSARRGSALRRCALSTAAPPPDFRRKLRRKAELGAAARCALSTAAPTSDFRRKLRCKAELGAAALRAPDRGAAPRLTVAIYGVRCVFRRGRPGVGEVTGGQGSTHVVCSCPYPHGGTYDAGGRIRSLSLDLSLCWGTRMLQRYWRGVQRRRGSEARRPPPQQLCAAGVAKSEE